MSFLQQELKKILNLTHCAGDVAYIGSTGYVRVNADVRMRLAFAQSSTTSYEGIVMTMLNRKDGPIDTNVLKFKDILGKKPVSNSYFEEGIAPHIWEYREKWNGMLINRAVRIIRCWQMKSAVMPICFRSRKQPKGLRCICEFKR